MKNSRPTPAPGAGVLTPAVSSTPAKDPGPRFIKNKKGEVICSFTEADVEREDREQKAWLEREGLKDEVSPVAGIPDDIMDKLESVAGDDEKATRAARTELQELLLKGVVPQLLRFALEKKESEAKKWSGVILASIGCSIEKYDKALCQTNGAYLSEKKKILGEKQLGWVLIPGPIMETVERELNKAESYRGSLPYLIEGFGRTWVKSNLADYLPFMELPEFSLQSKPQWWKLLWPLIKKNNDDLLPKLQRRSDRSERAIPGDPKSGTRKIKQGWKGYRNEFRNALYTLARLRSGGVR